MIKNYKNHIPDNLKENQNLKEIIEVAKQISAGMDVDYITKNVNMIISAKFDPKLKGFILQNDIDDLSPIFYYYTDKGMDKKKLKFNSIIPLNKFFEEQEYNQITFSQFSKYFDHKNIVEELKKYSPEFIIPLRSYKSILGLYIQGEKADKKPYTIDDIQFCINILNFGAIALENANLYREATVDRMTKLYTHHQFQERLEKDIKKSHRYGNIFSIIMFDIDHFKTFNDKYGHLQGDIIIKEIAEILLNSTRSIDFPSRYGGEEFILLLPEININQAYHVAERLRKTVEKHKFSGKGGPYKVTISVGVAEFDANIIFYNNDLIELVDQALYMSKKSGRNLVTMANKKII